MVHGEEGRGRPPAKESQDILTLIRGLTSHQISDLSSSRVLTLADASKKSRLRHVIPKSAPAARTTVVPLRSVFIPIPDYANTKERSLYAIHRCESAPALSSGFRR